MLVVQPLNFVFRILLDNKVIFSDVVTVEEGKVTTLDASTYIDESRYAQKQPVIKSPHLV